MFIQYNFHIYFFWIYSFESFNNREKNIISKLVSFQRWPSEINWGNCTLEKVAPSTRAKDDASGQPRNDIQKGHGKRLGWDGSKATRSLSTTYKVKDSLPQRVTGVEATKSDGHPTCREFRAEKRLRRVHAVRFGVAELRRADGRR